MRRSLFWAALPLFVGCEAPKLLPTGELGHGQFHYACAGSGDPSCTSSDAISPVDQASNFPPECHPMLFGHDGGLGGQSSSYDCVDPLSQPVAVGALFGITYEGDGGKVTVEPAAPELGAAADGFAAPKPGAYAFLARSPAGVVADMAHVEVAAPFRLEVWRNGVALDNGTGLAKGETIVLAVIARDKHGRALAGAGAYSWTSLNDGIVQVLPVDGFSTTETFQVKLAAKFAANTWVIVKLGSLMRGIPVEVTP